jgi:uncharacterized protein (TIGR02646 family)
LKNRQSAADDQSRKGQLKINDHWKDSRKTKAMGRVVGTLQGMMGSRERCMYCLDSHGSDIEHFWPKAEFPEKMYQWPNLLLCCTECGRFKGNTFPLSHEKPLLIDPTAEEPWDYLDFDPKTGNIMARFDKTTNNKSEKGSKTVKVLQLNRREALADGYKKTFRKIKAEVERKLSETSPDAAEFKKFIGDIDEHGLIGWGFIGVGREQSPFSDLRKRHPKFWEEIHSWLSQA